MYICPMASAKITSKDKPNKDGTVSVSLQIIHNRKQYPKVLLRVPAKYWDTKKKEVRPGCPDYILHNQYILQELNDAKTYILECRNKKIPFDPARYLSSVAVEGDLISHLQAKADLLEEPRTKGKYLTCITRVEDAGMNEPIININEQWIKSFDAYLKGRGNNPNTRAKYLSMIGSVMRLARINGLIQVNPFEGRKKSKSPSKKAKLTLEEFRRIQELRCDDHRLELVRRMFVFATLARGMRAYDVLTLTWSDITDRIRYTAQKARTGEEGKMFDIKITEGLAACLEGLDRSTEYVFPFVAVQKKMVAINKHRYKAKVGSALVLVNKDLKIIAELAKISKVLTMHVARHTFAFIASEANKPLATIQNLLGHSDLTTTKIYIESIRAAGELDEAVEELF